MTWSGTWGGSAGITETTIHTITGHYQNVFSVHGHNFQVFQPGYWGVQLSAECDGIDTSGFPYNTNGVSIYGSFDPSLVFAGLIKPYTPSFYAHKGFPRDPLHLLPNWDYSGGGNWQASIDAEECYTVYIEIDDDTGAPLFPNYGGRVQSEPPYSFKRVWFEQAKVGGFMRISASYNELNRSISASILGNFPISYPVDVNGIVDCFHGNYYGDGPTSSSASGYCLFDQTMDVWGLEWNYDYTLGGADAISSHVALNGGISASASENGTHQATQLGDTFNFGRCSQFIYTTFSPAKRAHVKGKLFADKNPYPGKTRVTIRGDVKSDIVDVLDGEFETNILQKFGYSVISTGGSFGVISASKQSQGISEWQPLYCYITPSGNQSNFEDTDDWRIGFKSLAFNAFSLYQKPGLTVDDGSSLNPTDSTKSMPGQWSAPKPATVTSTANGISISIADNKNSGTASRGFRDLDSKFYGASFGGFRYIRFRIRGTKEGLPFTVKLTNQDGVKTWNMVTGAKDTFTDVDLDLCNPHDKVVPTDGGQDGHDTQWPFKGDYQNSRYIDSDYSGCTHVSTLALSNLQNNATYDIASISLLMKDHAKINIEPAFKNLVNEVDDDPLTKTVRVRTVMGETDGRKSLEVTDFKVDPLGIPLIGSLAGVMADCNFSGNAWVSTASVDAPYDSWHTMGLEGVHAWGGGVVFAKVDDKDPDFHVGLDLDARG